MEQSLIAPTGALAGLGVGTPLDHPGQDVRARCGQDGTSRSDLETTTSWGGEGSLWTPHVYMPAQNPGDPPPA